MAKTQTYTRERSDLPDLRKPKGYDASKDYEIQKLINSNINSVPD